VRGRERRLSEKIRVAGVRRERSVGKQRGKMSQRTQRRVVLDGVQMCGEIMRPQHSVAANEGKDRERRQLRRGSRTTGQLGSHERRRKRTHARGSNAPHPRSCVCLPVGCGSLCLAAAAFFFVLRLRTALRQLHSKTNDDCRRRRAKRGRRGKEEEGRAREADSIALVCFIRVCAQLPP
jgi:hypothetical protein